MRSTLLGLWTKRLMLVSLGVMGSITTAHALPPVLNSSGLTPQQCYRRDSSCTQMCGEVGEMRYECFSICDRMLDRCLTTGEWTDSLTVDPGTGKPPEKGPLLSGLLMRMLMVLADRDANGEVTPKEIQTLKDSVFEKDDGKTPPSTPKQQK